MGMTGSALTRRMLQIRPEIPNILCTGYSSLIAKDKEMSSEIQRVAMKSLTKKDIAANTCKTNSALFFLRKIA